MANASEEKRLLKEVRVLRTEMVVLERRLTRKIAEQAQELARLRAELCGQEYSG